MRQSNAIYYLLFVLLVMGAFASMAQNDYGQQILAGVAITFCLLFAGQAIVLIRSDKLNLLSVVERTCLGILAAILAMRIFYVRFAFVEWVFATAGILLILTYVIRMKNTFGKVGAGNAMLGWITFVFQASIVAYVLSMTITPLAPALSEPIGIVAFLLVITFAGLNVMKGDFLVEGEKVTPIQFIGRMGDQSIHIMILFLLFTAYMGLTRIKLIPKMYSDEFPSAYFQLVKKAEVGEDAAVNNRYKHEEFKALYDRFVDRHQLKEE
jgi:hypothetical protein